MRREIHIHIESVKETETEGNAKKRGDATVGVRERDWVREIERKK